MRKAISDLSMLGGVILLALNLWGVLKPAESPYRQAPESAPAGYYDRTISPRAARKEFEILGASVKSEEEKAARLLELVSGSFIHRRESAYLIKPWDNWLLWLAGFWDKRYRISQDADFLWRRGAGFCDQAAVVFVAAAKKLGLLAGLLWLDGHVLAEVLVPGQGWRVVDADMGIFWESGLEQLRARLSEEQLAGRLIESGFTARLAGRLAAIYAHSPIRRSSLPYLPWLQRREMLAGKLKWALPLCLIVCAVGLRRPVCR